MPTSSGWAWSRGRTDDRWSYWEATESEQRSTEWDQSSTDWGQPNTDWSNYAPVSQSTHSAVTHESPWPEVAAAPGASSSSTARADEALTDLITELVHGLQAEVRRGHEVEAALRYRSQQRERESRELTKRRALIETMKKDLARRTSQLLAIGEQVGQSAPSSSSRSSAVAQSSPQSLLKVSSTQPNAAPATFNDTLQRWRDREKQVAPLIPTGRDMARGDSQTQPPSSPQNLYPPCRDPEWESAVLCGNTSRSGQSIIAVDISSLIFTLDEYDLDENSKIDSRFQFAHEEWRRDVQKVSKRVHTSAMYHEASLGSLDKNLEQVLLADCEMMP